ncbi:hypothetical protein RIF29_43349 [Crotalaria pallida]|uniref:Uncharacterized protein n=1 Tax=Crotalaria pallida TaxID=3830 RepID=A0AAN9E279_CROPI
MPFATFAQSSDKGKKPMASAAVKKGPRLRLRSQSSAKSLEIGKAASPNSIQNLVSRGKGKGWKGNPFTISDITIPRLLLRGRGLTISQYGCFLGSASLSVQKDPYAPGLPIGSPTRHSVPSASAVTGFEPLDESRLE